MSVNRHSRLHRRPCNDAPVADSRPPREVWWVASCGSAPPSAASAAAVSDAAAPRHPDQQATSGCLSALEQTPPVTHPATRAVAERRSPPPASQVSVRRRRRPRAAGGWAASAPCVSRRSCSRRWRVCKQEVVRGLPPRTALAVVVCGVTPPWLALVKGPPVERMRGGAGGDVGVQQTHARLIAPEAAPPPPPQAAIADGGSRRVAPCGSVGPSGCVGVGARGTGSPRDDHSSPPRRRRGASDGSGRTHAPPPSAAVSGVVVALAASGRAPRRCTSCTRCIDRAVGEWSVVRIACVGRGAGATEAGRSRDQRVYQGGRRRRCASCRARVSATPPHRRRAPTAARSCATPCWSRHLASTSAEPPPPAPPRPTPPRLCPPDVRAVPEVMGMATPSPPLSHGVLPPCVGADAQMAILSYALGASQAARDRVFMTCRECGWQQHIRRSRCNHCGAAKAAALEQKRKKKRKRPAAGSAADTAGPPPGTLSIALSSDGAGGGDSGGVPLSPRSPPPWTLSGGAPTAAAGAAASAAAPAAASTVDVVVVPDKAAEEALIATNLSHLSDVLGDSAAPPPPRRKAPTGGRGRRLPPVTTRAAAGGGRSGAGMPPLTLTRSASVATAAAASPPPARGTPAHGAAAAHRCTVKRFKPQPPPSLLAVGAAPPLADAWAPAAAPTAAAAAGDAPGWDDMSLPALLEPPVAGLDLWAADVGNDVDAAAAVSSTTGGSAAASHECADAFVDVSPAASPRGVMDPMFEGVVVGDEALGGGADDGLEDLLAPLTELPGASYF